MQNPVPAAQLSVFYGTPGTEQNNRVRRLGGDDPEHFIGGIVFPRDEADGNGHVFFAFREHFLEIADLFFARRARLGNENDVFHVREYLCGEQCILIPEVARFDSGHVCFSRELQRKRSVIGGYEHRRIDGQRERPVEKQIHGRVVAENDEIVFPAQLFADRLHVCGRGFVAEVVPHPDLVHFAVEHHFLIVEILLDPLVDVPRKRVGGRVGVDLQNAVGFLFRFCLFRKSRKVADEDKKADDEFACFFHIVFPLFSSLILNIKIPLMRKYSPGMKTVKSGKKIFFSCLPPFRPFVFAEILKEYLRSSLFLKSVCTQKTGEPHFF